MQTKYAYGRTTLPAPTVTTEDGGSISGNGDTYYFWIKARNRVGYNNVSNSTSLIVGNAKKIRIAASSFATFDFEGWMHMVVSVSKTNDFSTSRIIYKQEIYDPLQVTKLSITDVLIDSNYVLNGNAGSVEVADLIGLPQSGMVNGLRVYMLSTERVYEYNAISNLPADNITVIPANVGQWLAVQSNSLLENDTNCTKELFQVNETDLIEAGLPSVFQAPVAISYYLVNNELTGLTEGELELNSYISDSSLGVNYYVKVLGYLNLTTFVLDTSGIDYVNTVVTYPETKISLVKTLPSNSALVVEVVPNLLLDTPIVEGTYITLYPKLNPYTVIGGIPDFGEPIPDIASLKAIPPSAYKDRQIRYVESKRTLYAYDNESELVDNGDTILAPTGIVGAGRWLANNVNILPDTITPDMLSNSTLDLITGGIETSSAILPISAPFNIDTDASSVDYFIITTPVDDGGTTVIDITGTLTNNTTKAVLLELRQQTGLVQFHNSIAFPGGTLPVLSGNGKTDLFVMKLVKDGAGLLKKRAFMVQKDVG